MGSQAQTNLLTVRSAAKQIPLLELYTSEGCSSCPPAEEWLNRLKDSSALWRDFVPVAFHVDYWDRLGWRDPWAARAFSDRQRNYAGQWRTDSIYTPEFVFNGREWPDWRNKAVPTGGEVQSGSLTASSSDTNHWVVSFTPVAASGMEYQVHAALLAGGLNSDVRAGENRGRRLTHEFVAIKLVNAQMVRRGDSFTGEVTFDPLPNAADSRLAIAVWVTGAGQLQPLQAAGGWLSPRIR